MRIEAEYPTDDDRGLLKNGLHGYGAIGITLNRLMGSSAVRNEAPLLRRFCLSRAAQGWRLCARRRGSLRPQGPVRLFLWPRLPTQERVEVGDLDPDKEIFRGRFGDLGLINGQWRILGAELDRIAVAHSRTREAARPRPRKAYARTLFGC